MEPPGITRHRRPFLAPLYLGLLAAAVLFALGWAFYSTATTTVVFLVSPVAKAPGAIDDPPVSPEGEARAERLAHMFGEDRGAGRLDGIYESEDRRAEQTAAPLIERMHRSPVVFRAAESASRVSAAHTSRVSACDTGRQVVVRSLRAPRPALSATARRTNASCSLMRKLASTAARM